MISGKNYDVMSVNNFLLRSSGNLFLAGGNVAFLLFFFFRILLPVSLFIS